MALQLMKHSAKAQENDAWRTAQNAATARRRKLALVPVNRAVLHHKGNILGGLDVVQRISGHGDHVGQHTRFKDADLILEAE